MTEPKRIHDTGDAFEQSLLGSARGEGMSSAARTALFAAAAAGALAGASTAVASAGGLAAGAAGHGGAAAGASGTLAAGAAGGAKATVVGASLAAKWLGASVLATALAVGAAPSVRSTLGLGVRNAKPALVAIPGVAPPLEIAPIMANPPPALVSNPEVAPRLELATIATSAVAATPVSAPAPRLEGVRAAMAAPLVTPASPAPPAAAGSTGSPVSVDAERELLTRARAAVRLGEFGRAMDVLAAHARTSPTPVLAEEADVLRVMALEARDPEGARLVALRFVREHPQSPYLERMRRAAARGSR